MEHAIEHGSHTKRRMHMGGMKKEKETKTLNVVDVLTVEEKFSYLKLTEVTIRR
jgi:hypothetical protein